MNIDFITDKKMWLAPLAGYTDAPFRYIAKKCGADVLVSEMVSADGVKKNFDKMAHYTKFTEAERPFGIQLFGDNPAVMARAAHLLSRLRPDFFDINMGCPVKKVVKRYAGSALMLKPDLAEQIIREVVGVLSNEGIPLTVKFRAGWDFDCINAIPFAQMAEATGVSAVVVHPRTRSQFFTGKSNWDVIRQVKEAISIPVVGNGDILTHTDAIKMYETTKCDSIMIGRGALGKPWIFNELKDNNAESKMSNEEMLAIMIEHVDKVIEHNQDTSSLVPMRAHFAFYTKGFAGSAKARQIIFATTDPAEIKETLEKLIYGKL
jgi:tRNA-dihydrouridine synthase B